MEKKCTTLCMAAFKILPRLTLTMNNSLEIVSLEQIRPNKLFLQKFNFSKF